MKSYLNKYHKFNLVIILYYKFFSRTQTDGCKIYYISFLNNKAINLLIQNEYSKQLAVSYTKSKIFQNV